MPALTYFGQPQHNNTTKKTKTTTTVNLAFLVEHLVRKTPQQFFVSSINLHLSLYLQLGISTTLLIFVSSYHKLSGV